jgi:hypothetical protein
MSTNLIFFSIFAIGYLIFAENLIKIATNIIKSIIIH